MINQYIWIGIIIGVFFVGIGISYAIFSNTYNPNSMKFANQEIFDQMMSQNPKMMAHWMVHDPKHVEEMSIAMSENHDFMMEMMSVMMNDPALRLQMLGHMTENPESMEQMKKMMGQSMMESMANQKQCEDIDGLWGIWGNQPSLTASCNPATSDVGKECTDSSQCQSFCQANEGAEINSEEAGTCYGYELAICMQEVRNGVVEFEWCQ